ncbi:protein [Escherichia coli]|uniref:Fumarase D n=21 Tax=Enterobacterales TaxID=91347 RepID=A0A376K1J8_ECOLX|nr:protein [Escherichia coli]
MSGSAFAVTHHAFSSGAGRTSDGNGSHASTLKSPSYTKSVSWQHYQENELYREMCRVVGKVVLEMRDLGQEPKHIVIAGVLRTALANKRIQRSELEKQAMETVINALVK